MELRDGFLKIGRALRQADREPDEPRPVALDGLDEGIRRHAGAEIHDVEPGAFEHIRRHSETQLVMLSLESGEQDPLSPLDRTIDEAPVDLDQRAMHERRGEVLVGHGDLTPFPEVAHAVHRRGDHGVEDLDGAQPSLFAFLRQSRHAPGIAGEEGLRESA
jgi:hypothetical protein